ncbi:hypothetical protein DFH08DRAFT_968585 [Mycena albidolilacea]|uniref:Zn(2)-C6 fungal-type domain-containing protein n=1 Tax=Mycena albidolilacea TaxID=1033008 RepID=A0AAD6ZJD0_9AGAR|nr:hypothetical protein DFH08DRAFT_968585 [Mycena albidolilacea]
MPTTQKTSPQLAKRVQKDLGDGSSWNNRNSFEALLALELYGPIIDISADTETTWVGRRSSDVVVRLGPEMAYITHENRRAWLICGEGFSQPPQHLNFFHPVGHPAPHDSFASAPAYGGKLCLSDGPHANNTRRAAGGLFLPQHIAASRPDWRPTASATSRFTPPAPWYQLPAELEPPSHYDLIAQVPVYYPPSNATCETDEYDDNTFSALADQYLDLSERCPLPSVESRSVSPYTDTSEVPDVNLRAAKRQRTDDWEFLRLPKAPAFVDEDSPTGDSGSREHEPPRLSPFRHSPLSLPAHELDPIFEVPGPLRTENKQRAAPQPRPPGTLKFTEARKDGRSKRQELACLFCRERKIACGRPPKKSGEQTCNQCVRRNRECVYPTESRRGQHSRLKSLARHAQMAHATQPVGMMYLLN